MRFRQDTLVHGTRCRRPSGKRHRCYWCHEEIAPGSQSVVVAGQHEGDLYTARFHPACWRAEHFWWKGDDKPECWPEEGSMKRGCLLDCWSTKTPSVTYSNALLTREEVANSHKHAHQWAVIQTESQNP